MVLPHKFRNITVSSFSNTQGRADAVIVETKNTGGIMASNEQEI